ncbi:hypothetical protein PPL_12169 [Heterostelium album PN500]|uniref:Uncharacterized protein n=1 Tax=Heterostelium pallidum (strain ATCC 26659 / Pp 5 / PN500) TaxID=670386 RepID=D3BLW5_HETP5|nr:hypothetical protein PPL_12169 [Heterostelium album PN500]EFA77566.1 hypothetical protein PPL_12169 [Heterostelium album PN500]|eukprot:XP_020429694.1 hypothetical protein PPL_12169 [Heterostelium album PN500]
MESLDNYIEEEEDEESLMNLNPESPLDLNLFANPIKLGKKKQIFEYQKMSTSLQQSNYYFLVTPNYFWSKVPNQHMCVNLFNVNEVNRVYKKHSPFQLNFKVSKWQPHSKSPSVIDEATVVSKLQNVFSKGPTTLEDGEALMEELIFDNAGTYTIKCYGVILDQDIHTDFSFKFTINAIGERSPSKTSKDNSKSKKKKDVYIEEKFTTDFNHERKVKMEVDMARVQEKAEWDKYDQLSVQYTSEFRKIPFLYSKLLISQGIGSTYLGNYGESHRLFDKALEKDSSLENLFEASTMRSVSHRIQKNFKASELLLTFATSLYLDLKDKYPKKICQFTNLLMGQYYFNYAAHHSDLFQMNFKNNLKKEEEVKDLFKKSMDYYNRDCENSKANGSEVNARSINGYYRSNIRIVQTIIGSNNTKEQDLNNAYLQFLKACKILKLIVSIIRILKKNFLYDLNATRTQIHFHFTLADLHRKKFQITNNQSYDFKRDCLSDFLKSIKQSYDSAYRNGFRNEMRYNTDRFYDLDNQANNSKNPDLDLKTLLGTLTGYGELVEDMKSLSFSQSKSVRIREIDENGNEIVKKQKINHSQTQAIATKVHHVSPLYYLLSLSVNSSFIRDQLDQLPSTKFMSLEQRQQSLTLKAQLEYLNSLELKTKTDFPLYNQQ